MGISSSIWTYEVTKDELILGEENALTIVSLLVTEGYVTIIGDKSAGKLPPKAITLFEGQSITFASDSSYPLGTLTINAFQGTVVLTGK